MKLNNLVSTGGDFYVAEGTLYDLSAVINPNLKLRMVKGLDLLLDAGKSGGAAGLLVAGIRSRNNRKIRYYDDDKQSRAGTLTPPTTEIVATGTAQWRRLGSTSTDPRQNDPKVAVSERGDERIWLNPLLAFPFANVVELVWHEMTHVFTTYTHGIWNPTGGFQDPQAPENVAWSGFMGSLRAMAPVSAEDPVDNQPDFIRNGTPWTCNCGTRHVG